MLAVLAIQLFYVQLCYCGSLSLIVLAGQEETVFLHNRDACSAQDVPDAPARAFRDSGGNTHLFAAHFVNFGLVGATLNAVKRDCRIAFHGGNSDSPSDFDDKEWLTSFWTDDGDRIFALVHNEFQANRRPSLCPTGVYFECWYNAIVAAVSNDGGFRFTRSAIAIVAAPQYPFDPTIGHPVGYFGTSNIVKREGFYYVMVWAENVGAQKRGVCLLRTKHVGEPDSWLAWGGTAFDVRLRSPYGRRDPYPSQVCAPIQQNRLKASVLSLVRHRDTGHYLALMSFEDGPDPAFVVSESTDLFTWSEVTKVMSTSPPATMKCGNRPQLAYASLLDPNSPSQNFEIITDTAYLYFTRFNLEECSVRLNRDLVRIPVKIKTH